MIPAKPDKPTVNPREAVRQGGAELFARYLANTGYMIQDRILRDLVQAIKAGTPHLVEGPRGSGKTALAEAVADGFNLPLFYLQGMEGLQLEEVLYSWDRDSQAEYVRQALMCGTSLEEARANQWGREYLMAGEALAAFEYAATHEDVPILVVDEIDKLKESLEDMLLQLFGRGFAHVPRFGNVGVADRRRWPIVILASNNIRHDLSAPLRSRCVYSYLELPSACERVVILKARVPAATATQVRYVARLLFAIDGIPGVVDKPALREGIALLEALVRDEVGGRITEEILLDYLCLIAKRENDTRYLRAAAARLEKDINSPHTEIDAWVEEEFRFRLSMVA